MMRLLSSMLLLCCSCAVGFATSDGTAVGVAFGQAEIRSCRPPAEGEPPEAACAYVRGGQISGNAVELVQAPGMLEKLRDVGWWAARKALGLLF